MLKELNSGALRAAVRPVASSKGRWAVVCPATPYTAHTEQVVRLNVVADAACAKVDARQQPAQDRHGSCIRKGPFPILDEVIASVDVIQGLTALLHVV